MKVTVTRSFNEKYEIIQNIVTEQDQEIQIELKITVDGEPFDWIRHSALLSKVVMPTPENTSKDKKLTEAEKTIQLISMTEIWTMLKNLGTREIEVKKKQQQVVFDSLITAFEDIPISDPAGIEEEYDEMSLIPVDKEKE